jgi:hypothetical protein
MEDKLQLIRNWAKLGNLKQFCGEIQNRLGPLGYEADLDMDKIRCYRVRTEKGLMGLRKREVREPVGVIRRQNGSIELMDTDAAFLDVLASVAPVV